MFGSKIKFITDHDAIAIDPRHSQVHHVHFRSNDPSFLRLLYVTEADRYERPHSSMHVYNFRNDFFLVAFAHFMEKLKFF